MVARYSRQLAAVGKENITILLSVSVIVVALYSWAIFSCSSDGLIGSIVGLTLTIGFYAFVFFGARFKEAKNVIKEIPKKEAILFSVIVIAIGIFIIWFIAGERFIYYWDYGSYWYQSLNVSNGLLSPSWLSSVSSVYQSINTSDYNTVLALLMAVPLNMLGNSYVAFVGLTYFMFFVPAVFLISITLRCISAGKEQVLPFWLYGIMAASFPLFLVPILDGYIDAAGLTVMALCLLIVLGNSDPTKKNIRTVFYLGVALVLVLLFRRYFAYWVVGFAASILVYCLAGLVRFKGDKRKYLTGCLFNYGFAGLLAIAVLVAFFSGFLELSFFNNHAIAYSAYDSGSGFVGKLSSVIQTIGVPFAVLCALGLFISFAIGQYRRIFLFVGGGCAVSSLMFWRIQDMGVQHYYILAIEIFILIAVSVSLILAVVRRTRNRYASYAVNVLYVVVCIYSALSLGSATLFASGGENCLFSSEGHQQLKRSDFEEIDSMTDGIPSGSTVYVIASSGVMNQDIFAKRLIQRGIPLDRFGLINVPQVDLRDGFSPEFFSADIVIACLPVQTHLKEGSQQVITLLNQLVLDEESPAGKHYAVISEHELDDGVKAIVLKRENAYQREDIEEIARLFDALYPNNKDIFYDRIMAQGGANL